MSSLELTGKQYILYLEGLRTQMPAHGSGRAFQNAIGQGAVALCKSPQAEPQRFFFTTTDNIGFTPETFFVARPFDTLCDGTSREDIVQKLEQYPRPLLVDALCQQVLETIAAWNAAQLAQHRKRYRVFPPSIQLGCIDRHLIEIGFGLRSPTQTELVFDD